MLAWPPFSTRRRYSFARSPLAWILCCANSACAAAGRFKRDEGRRIEPLRIQPWRCRQLQALRGNPEARRQDIVAKQRMFEQPEYAGGLQHHAVGALHILGTAVLDRRADAAQ